MPCAGMSNKELVMPSQLNDHTNNVISNTTNTGGSDSSCTLCIECNPECDKCTMCSDMFRVCDLCLSCNNYDLGQFQKAQTSCNNANLSVLHVNIRSITLNFEPLEDMMNDCLKPDILALSKTRINENTPINEIQIDGYTFIAKNSKTLAGGTGMYISKHLNYVERPDLARLNLILMAVRQSLLNYKQKETLNRKM